MPRLARGDFLEPPQADGIPILTKSALSDKDQTLHLDSTQRLLQPCSARSTTGQRGPDDETATSGGYPDVPALWGAILYGWA